MGKVMQLLTMLDMTMLDFLMLSLSFRWAKRGHRGESLSPVFFSV